MSRRVTFAASALIVAGVYLYGGVMHGLFSSTARAQDTANKLVGTWKLVSAKYGGRESTLPKDATTLKLVTPTHYTWVTFDKDGQVTRTGGGTYAFNGEDLKSTSEYGLDRNFEAIKGTRQSFKIKFEGNRWTQLGTLSTGTTLEEVWERVDNQK
jgi:hypothetical protein